MCKKLQIDFKISTTEIFPYRIISIDEIISRNYILPIVTYTTIKRRVISVAAE